MLCGVIFITLGLFFNQWTLNSVLYLYDGQISILRILIIWIYDLTCIIIGINFILQKKKPVYPFKNFIFTGIMCLLMLLFSEGVLQLITRISPDIDRILSNKHISRQISDPILGIRPNPEFPEHDSSGFRNKVALSQSDIVAIGDSQTYGTNVKRFQAWPQQLNQISKKSVYNMSFGGYGSVEGLLLLKTQAVHLSPKQIVYMMYDGNDYVDAYDAVYNYNLYDALKSKDPNTLESITRLQKQDPLILKIKAITSQLWARKKLSKNQKRTDIRIGDKSQNFWGMIKQSKLLKLFFSLERIFQNTFVDDKESNWKRVTQTHYETNLFEVFQSDDFKTIFTPSYRQIAINFEDIRLQEGHRITLDSVRLMNEVSAKGSIDFLVLLLPIKEFIFNELLVREGYVTSESLQFTIDAQSKIRVQNIEYLNQHSIPYIDMLPILQNCIENNQQPFFVDYDGHLNSIGHKAVAEAVNAYLQQNRQ